MITQAEAIEIAKKAVEGTYKPEELERVEVALQDDRYIVKLVLGLPPLTVGRGFIQVTLDACCGRVLGRLMDAD